MKWHEWILTSSVARKMGLELEELFDHIDRTVSCNSNRPQANTKLMQMRYMVEDRWCRQRRPYYSLFRNVGEGLIGTSLDISAEYLRPPIDTLLVRLPVGQELKLCGSQFLHSMIVQSFMNETGKGVLSVYMNINGAFGSIQAMLNVGETIESAINDTFKTTPLRHATNSLDCSDTPTSIKMCVRLACAVSLLDEQSGLLSPDVLTDDQAKYDAATTDEERSRLVNRARNRGKYGWTIGKNLEVSPHLRRPHFGIRHTGDGGRTPKLVPIKGCVVKREKMGHVPTGYLDAPLCTTCKLLPAVDGEQCESCLAVTV